MHLLIQTCGLQKVGQYFLSGEKGLNKTWNNNSPAMLSSGSIFYMAAPWLPPGGYSVFDLAVVRLKKPSWCGFHEQTPYITCSVYIQYILVSYYRYDITYLILCVVVFCSVFLKLDTIDTYNINPHMYIYIYIYIWSRDPWSRPPPHGMEVQPPRTTGGRDLYTAYIAYTIYTIYTIYK